MRVGSSYSSPQQFVFHSASCHWSRRCFFACSSLWVGFWKRRISAPHPLPDSPPFGAAGLPVVCVVGEFLCAHGFAGQIRWASHELREGRLWGWLDEGGRRQVHSGVPGQAQDLEGKMCAEELWLGYLPRPNLQVRLASTYVPPTKQQKQGTTPFVRVFPFF